MYMELERAKGRLFRSLRRLIRDEKVLAAMERVPRELFVPTESQDRAYDDVPLPIGEGQTISQPSIVGIMTSALGLTGAERVLELGTGSGYQAAVLSLLVPNGRVLTLERVPALAREADALLHSLGYSNITVRLAGPRLGCPGEGPFDAIIVTAAAPRLPQSLLAQMAVGGRMVLPVGNLQEQELVKVLRTGEGHSVSVLGACRFVPLIGEEAWPE